jgi:hypothetical protein
MTLCRNFQIAPCVLGQFWHRRELIGIQGVVQKAMVPFTNSSYFAQNVC